MIAIFKKEINSKNIKSLMASINPIAVIVADREFGTCYIHEVQKESLTVEDSFGQVYVIERRDIISMEFFETKDIFKRMKENKQLIFRIRRFLNRLHDQLEKHIW